MTSKDYKSKSNELKPKLENKDISDILNIVEDFKNDIKYLKLLDVNDIKKFLLI